MDGITGQGLGEIGRRCVRVEHHRPRNLGRNDQRIGSRGIVQKRFLEAFLGGIGDKLVTYKSYIYLITDRSS